MKYSISETNAFVRAIGLTPASSADEKPYARGVFVRQSVDDTLTQLLSLLPFPDHIESSLEVNVEISLVWIWAVPGKDYRDPSFTLRLARHGPLRLHSPFGTYLAVGEGFQEFYRLKFCLLRKEIK